MQVNGAPRTITTVVTLEDLDSNGIGCCEPVRRLFATGLIHSDPIESLGVFLALANICRSNGRALDELAALRSARRIAPRPQFTEPIRAILERCHRVVRFDPSERTAGYTIVARDVSHKEFEARSNGHLTCENMYYAIPPYRDVTSAGIDPPIVDGYDNLSFHVCRGDTLVATVPVIVDANSVARWEAFVPNFGHIPARVHFTDDCDDPRKTVDVILEYLYFLMRAHGARGALLQEPSMEKMHLYRALFKEDIFSAELWTQPEIDLRVPEADIFRNVRTSYKSQINWCRQNLSVEYFSGERLDDATAESLLAILRACHQKVVEKANVDMLSTEKFMLAVAMCRAGRGEAAIARDLAGDACAIVIATDTGENSYYTLGGQLQLGNKSPGDFIVFDSILRAKQRGMRRYHTDALKPAPMHIEGDLLWIDPLEWKPNQFFKSGFSDALEVAYCYRIPSNMGRSAEKQRFAMSGKRAGKAFDAAMDVTTEALIYIDDLDPAVVGASIAHATRYAPVPIAEFETMLDALPLAPQTTTFLDVGSGQGRAVLLAAARPFRRIVGVDISPDLIETAGRNLARYRGEIVCRDIDFVRSDIAEFALPDGDLTVFLCNPFDRTILAPLAERLAQRDGRTVVLYHTQVHRGVLDEHPAFHLVETFAFGLIYATG
jgi:SAM-dependent methyltransferase